mgnify:CR=1 FL=1
MAAPLYDPLSFDFDNPLFGIETIRTINAQRHEMEQLTGIVHVDRERHGIDRQWETRERVVVAVTGAPNGESHDAVSERRFHSSANVAGERKGGLTVVSVEQVLLWNPEVIVTIDRDFAANVRSDPLWREVAAVRAGRVHLSPKLPFGWVDFPPSVNRLIGLWWLAQIFYPEHFKEDIRVLARDFYTRFYHVTPSDADLERVLAGRE